MDVWTTDVFLLNEIVIKFTFDCDFANNNQKTTCDAGRRTFLSLQIATVDQSFHIISFFFLPILFFNFRGQRLRLISSNFEWHLHNIFSS